MPENVKSFKSQIDALVAKMRASQEQNKQGWRERLAELKKKGYADGTMRPMDASLFEAIMYVSESRTEDDITTLTIIAELAKHVESLSDTVSPLSDLTEAIRKKTERMEQEDETAREFIENLGKKSGGQ